MPQKYLQFCTENIPRNKLNERTYEFIDVCRFVCLYVHLCVCLCTQCRKTKSCTHAWIKCIFFLKFFIFFFIFFLFDFVVLVIFSFFYWLFGLFLFLHCRTYIQTKKRMSVCCWCQPASQPACVIMLIVAGAWTIKKKRKTEYKRI